MYAYIRAISLSHERLMLNHSIFFNHQNEIDYFEHVCFHFPPFYAMVYISIYSFIHLFIFFFTFFFIAKFMLQTTWFQFIVFNYA